MEQEIWKAVIGYEGLYEVSSLGNIQKITNNKKTTVRITRDERYQRVSLSKNGKQISPSVQYVVAEAWVPNPNNYRRVLHINGNKHDNKSSNLQWVYKLRNPSKIKMIGAKHGLLSPIREIETSRSGVYRYECICDCGNICTVAGNHILEGVTKSCGCLTKRTGDNNKLWKGVGEISGNFWFNIISSAADRSDKKSHKGHVIEVTITIEDAWDLFLKQDRKCALSGIVLSFPRGTHDKIKTASLDRIDSSKGYIPGNVQWVHKHINMMKNRYNNEYFINICKQITIYQEEKFQKEKYGLD